MTAPKFKIESGVQLLARLTKKTQVENFFPVLFGRGLQHGDTVEILSSNSSSYLLLEIICEALFPGKQIVDLSGVLMFNTNGHFNYEDLIKILQRKIYSSLNSCLNNETRKLETERMLLKTLSNFFLVNIYDAMQFHTTIHNLDSIFMKHTNIFVLIIDSLTAFYWSEQGFKITKMDLYIKYLLKIIQKVSMEYKVILVYTRPGYFSNTNCEISDGVNFKIHMVDCSTGVYEVNVRYLDSYSTKYLSVKDYVIKWQ